MSHEESAAPLTITLSDDQSALSVAPHAGGRLMRWTVKGQDVIPWPANADMSKPAKVRGGNPLLFPFIGRHRVGDLANAWKDSAGTVHMLPQHGFARDLPFDAVRSDDGHSITMTLASSPATQEGYPYDFLFSVTYRLLEEGIHGHGLEIVLETRNTGDQPLPYYAGHHFYFSLPRALREESQLTLPGTLLCKQLPDGSISAPRCEQSSYAPGDSRIQDHFHILPQRSGKQPLNALLRTPSLGRTITLELNPLTETASATHEAPWYAITTWTESDESDFYCVEPWLGLPNAIHHGHGLRWIAPGESEQARCRIDVAFSSDNGNECAR